MSLKRVLKKIVSTALRPLGLDVVKARPRESLTGVLAQAKTVGLAPKTVIDVGAAFGGFALDCRTIFPAAQYILIEALEEYGPPLLAAIGKIDGVEYISAAAARDDGEITINVHADLVGSSTYREQESSNVDGTPRTVRAVKIDSLVDSLGAEGPFLLKIDVQGAELDVLAGAEKVLRAAEYVVLEVSFFEFFKGGPQFGAVVDFMKARGFVVYDILGLQYRLLDDALSQADVVFVKEAGAFRKDHSYATPGQRAEQDKVYGAAVGRLKDHV